MVGFLIIVIWVFGAVVSFNNDKDILKAILWPFYALKWFGTLILIFILFLVDRP